MTEYTIKYAGFDPQQRDAISAILDLSESALTCTWLVTDAPDSDMVMINLDAGNGQQMLTAERLLRPACRIILLAEHTDTETDGYWFLTKKPYAPPSLKELAKLLNEIAEVLVTADGTTVTPATLGNGSENSDAKAPPDADKDYAELPLPKNTAALIEPKKSGKLSHFLKVFLNK